MYTYPARNQYRTVFVPALGTVVASHDCIMGGAIVFSVSTSDYVREE
jgi:hypothetical protein